MLVSRFFISPAELWRLIGSPAAPQIVDVRRRAIYDAASGLLPGSVWKNAKDVATWGAKLDSNHPIIVACKAGHELSQSAAAELRSSGIDARVLEGGYNEWEAANLPVVSKTAVDRFALQRPSVWVTRRRPKIDRIACPWLIRRFIDAEAKILFADPPEVLAVAREIGAIPFDIEDVELSHDGPRCSFDTMLKLFGLEGETSLARLALIVRGADTAKLDLAPEAAGLLAISFGLSSLADDDDHGLLERGFTLYDALFAWLRYSRDERHNWPAKPAVSR